MKKITVKLLSISKLKVDEPIYIQIELNEIIQKTKVEVTHSLVCRGEFFPTEQLTFSIISKRSQTVLDTKKLPLDQFSAGGCYDQDVKFRKVCEISIRLTTGIPVSKGAKMSKSISIQNFKGKFSKFLPLGPSKEDKNPGASDEEESSKSQITHSRSHMVNLSSLADSPPSTIPLKRTLSEEGISEPSSKRKERSRSSKRKNRTPKSVEPSPSLNTKSSVTDPGRKHRRIRRKKSEVVDLESETNNTEEKEKEKERENPNKKDKYTHSVPVKKKKSKKGSLTPSTPRRTKKSKKETKSSDQDPPSEVDFVETLIDLRHSKDQGKKKETEGERERTTDTKKEKNQTLKKEKEAEEEAEESSSSSEAPLTTTRIFGVPLDVVMRSQKEKQPDLVVPLLFDTAGRIIRERGYTVKGIFRIRGKLREIKELKGKIDEGNPLPEDFQNVHLVTTLTKAFLRELPTPILTYENYDPFIQTADHQGDEQVQKLSDIVLGLPEENYNLLKFTFALLYDLSQNSEETQMTSDNLAKVISPNLIWKEELDILDLSAVQDAMKGNTIAVVMIEQHQKIFVK